MNWDKFFTWLIAIFDLCLGVYDLYYAFALNGASYFIILGIGLLICGGFHLFLAINNE